MPNYSSCDPICFLDSVITRLRILGLNENNYEILIARLKQKAAAHLCMITL